MRIEMLSPLIVMLALPCHAQQITSHPLIIAGMGLSSCGTYLTAAEEERALDAKYGSIPDLSRSGSYAAFESWAQGFLTGVNSASSSGLLGENTDTNGRMRWLDDYCQAHPLDKFFSAVTSLINELQRKGAL